MQQQLLLNEKQKDRFMSRVKITNDCWIWTGSIFRSGYGRFKANGRDSVAHRFSYRTFNSEIADGLELDHLCRNRKCVNPNHLEAVTHWTNAMRSPINPVAINFLKTKCNKGHLLEGNNVFIRKDGRRRCQWCEYDGKKIYRSTEFYKKKHAENERKRRLKLKMEGI